MITVVDRPNLTDNAHAVVFEYLDGAGNQELKNLEAAIFMADPSQDYNATTMANKVNELQGQDLAWEIRPTGVIQFCEGSLALAGVVTQGRMVGPSGKETDSWQANRQMLELKLAVAGFIGDWSLRWTDLSVQQAYGGTTSVSDRRSPQTRHGIYSILKNRQRKATSLLDLANSYDGDFESKYRYLRDHVDALVEKDILTKTSKHRAYDPLLEIKNERYYHVSTKLKDTSPETQALYKVVGEAGAGQVMSVNTLIDRAYQANKKIDTVKLRHFLRNGISTEKGYPGLKLVDPKFASEDCTDVALSPAVKKPIIQLTDGVEAIKNGEGIKEHGQRALDILNTPDDFAALVSKARRFSPRANSPGKKVLSDQLAGIVEELGEASVEQTRKVFQQTYNRKLTDTTVRATLNTLAEKGRLQRQKVAKDRHSQIVSNLYLPIAD